MFSIGEFSRVARVSTRLLRYYDQRGLLEPAHVDQATGYRRYSAAQLPRLNRILVLKELGFRLDEIAPILDQEIGAAELRGMLELRRSEAARRLEEEAARLRHIETRIAQLDELGALAQDDVVLRGEPARLFLAIRTRVPSFAAARDKLASVMAAARRDVARGKLEALAVLAHADAYDPDDLDLEIGYFVREAVSPVELAEGGRLEVRALPAVDMMAVCVRQGPPDRAHLATARIGRFVEHSGYRLEGPSREVFLEPPDLTRMDRAVVEMQFPVTPM